MARLVMGLIVIVATIGAAKVGRCDAPNEQSSDLVATVDAEWLATVATKATGSAAEIKRFSSGGRYLVLNRDGVVVLIVLRVCNDKNKCRGLWFLSPMKQPNPPFTFEQLNSFNISHPYASVHLFDADLLTLSRYVITDGGVTSANLEENIRIFMKMPQAVREDLRLRDSAPPASLGLQKPLASASIVDDVADIIPVLRGLRDALP